MTAKRFYLYPDSKKLQIILLFIFISFTLQAAKIQGYVFDEESGEPLIGANVMLEGTNVGTVSNSEGYYQLNSVVPGDYTIVASFIGYSEQRKDITVEKNQVLEINFQLQYGTIGIEEIQVTVQAKGQRKAINEQLGSTTISNFVSGDRIQEVPDANAAESVGRLPGISVKRSSGEGDQVVVRGLKPNLNLITINGVRMPSTNENNNAVGLSGISQYMLDGIEVRKSLTAQDDADVVGAIVDLKLATAQEGFHMNTVVESIYNGLTNNFGSYRASVQGSNRFFNNKLGAIANINLESVDRTRERYSAGFGRDTRVTTNEGVFLNNGSYQYHEIMRERFGTNIILDYKLPDGIIQFNTIYNSFVEDRWQRNLNYQVKPEASINKIQQSVETNNTSFVSSLNLETGLFDFAEFDLGASFTRGVRNDPVNQSLDFKYDARKDSPIDPEFLQNTYGKTGYDAIQHFRDRSEDYLVFGLWNNTKDFEQKERAIQSNLKIPFKLTKTISGFIKTGGKARFKSRDYDYEGDGKTGIYGADEKMRTAILQENPDYNWPFTAQERPALAEIPAYPLYDSWNRDILTDRVFLDEFASRGYVETVVSNLHEAGWADLDHWVINANDAVDDYNGEERLYAGYLMTELRWEDKLVINAGIRYEDEETPYKGWGITAIANEVNYPDTLEPSTRNNAFWLPSANAKFKYAEWADVRVAYSKSLARPEYYSFIPRYKADLRLSMSTAAGNKYLKPAAADNYDLIFSFYSKYLGLISAGGFYKEITDFYYVRSMKVIDEEEDNAVHGYETITVPKSQNIQVWYNSPEKATVKGLEFDLQSSFWYLPKPLNGLVLNANFSIMESRSKYYVSEIQKEFYGTRPWEFNEVRVDSFLTRRMIDQPDNTFNISLGYDYEGFSVRIAYNYQGHALAWKGSKNENDGFTQKYERWDLSMRQNLPVKGLSVQLLVNNITSVPDRQYVWQQKFNTFEEYYGITGSLGVKYKF